MPPISSSLLPCPALTHLSLYFCTDLHRRKGNGPLFPLFKVNRKLESFVVVVCEMDPIILIYFPRHLEMVTCQENIIHNISNEENIILYTVCKICIANAFIHAISGKITLLKQYFL